MNDDDPDEAWGRPSAYDLKESVILEKGFSPPPVPSRGNATPVEPLIDLDPMPSQIAPPSGATQEDEIRSIIFNYASTPSTRVSRNSTPTFATPFVPEDTNCNHDASLPSSSASSTSLLRLNALEEASSLLIMSQPQNISRVAPAGPVNQVMNDRARTRDDDALSFSETTTSGRLSDLSGYEDAETYSPRSRVMSPVRAHSLRPASFHQEGDQGGLVEDFEMVYARRGTMSVVSVSESEGEALGEGWRSEGEENEWDGLGLL